MRDAKFVYDDSVSPKQNLLRAQGQTADSWAGVLSPSDAEALSVLTGRSVQQILEVDVRFCMDEIRRRAEIDGAVDKLGELLAKYDIKPPRCGAECGDGWLPLIEALFVESDRARMGS